MAGPEDPVQFDIIESQKENIQSLPGGRSAKKLVGLFSASAAPGQPLSKIPTPTDTKNVNDAIRAEFEAEVASVADLDDPLDVYDRYVRWTLDAYPSAQATPQSQLHTLLERATGAFTGSAQYKNDPRYLKLWLYYIQFFSDAPRETFLYLSRHGIGEGLALFYEEYAAWLESASRWSQAEEVYRLGIEREARPQQRLVRKFGEFEQRRSQVAEDEDAAPSSPALPTVRPALAAKVDPFAITAPVDPQAPRQNNGVGGSNRSGKPAKSKLAIFSDAEAAKAPALSSREAGSKGWESISSLADRKKENIMEPKPWVGETLKAGGRKASGPKMAVFRDTSLLMKSHIPIVASQHQVTVNPQVGKRQRIVFDLRVLYPTPEIPGSELSFEEVLLARGGWLGERPKSATSAAHEDDAPSLRESPIRKNSENQNQSPRDNMLSDRVSHKLVVHCDVVPLDENGAIKEYPRVGRPKKKKVIEVNETQIIKAKLDSPSRPKLLKRKGSSEPTMTMHTKAATDDIYEIFNAPIKPAGAAQQEEETSAYDDDDTDDDYTSGPESTCTTTRRLSLDEAGNEGEGEEAGEEEVDVVDGDDASDVRSVSEWSDFTARKHMPKIPGINDSNGDESEGNNDATGFSDVGKESQPESERSPSSRGLDGENQDDDKDGQSDESDEVATPIEREDELPRTRTAYIPIPPEDYDPPRRPYRDPVEMANNRLPFMTPITERTETELDVPSSSEGRASFTKTPSRCPGGGGLPQAAIDDEDEDEEEDEEEPTANENDTAQSCDPPSSPLREVVDDKPVSPVKSVPQPQQRLPLLPKAGAKPLPVKGAPAPLPKRGPIIQDLQCNPVDEGIRAEILAGIHPPLSSQPRFYDHRPGKFEKGHEIRKIAKAIAKAKSGTGSTNSNNGGDKATNSSAVAVTIEFAGCEAKYTVKKELGAGAFAPVYLVENSHPDSRRSSGNVAEEVGDENAPIISEMGKGAFANPQSRRGELEALKMENNPPSAWEFHMMRLAHSRLGPHHRATASLTSALEMHMYQDEGFLFLPYHPHGTLLDVVNLFRAEPSGVMDELLAMFFSIELLRTVEALHSKQILHGDLKADNCLLRLGHLFSMLSSPEQQLSSQWQADGSGGWSSRGITLIDFGRAIDMRAFRPEVRFVADWKTSAQDCAEMREGRPWTWQIDYHGLAGTIHCLLFGKYIETVRCDNAASSGGLGLGAVSGSRRYKIRESLKRYWQTEIWADCFDVLLNPTSSAVAGEDGGQMPVLRGMRSVRERMEAWVEANCERGIGLRGLVGKVEAWAKGRR